MIKNPEDVKCEIAQRAAYFKLDRNCTIVTDVEAYNAFKAYRALLSFSDLIPMNTYQRLDLDDILRNMRPIFNENQ